MDTSRCHYRSSLLLSRSHVCSLNAYSQTRSFSCIPKLVRAPCRQQHGSVQQCAYYRLAHRPLQQHQSSICSSSSRRKCTCTVKALTQEPSTAVVQHRPSHRHIAGAGAPALLSLLTGSAAIAAEGGDAQASLEPDLLTTILFSATILALVILTVGVIYLSLTSFLDKRTENEARKKFDAAQKSRELQAANAGKTKVKRRRTQQDEMSRGGGKGFGG